MSARVTILLVAIVAIVGIAGCGDDDSSNSATTANGQSAAADDEGQGSGSDAGPDSQSAAADLEASDLSKAEYAKQANAICTRNTEERFAELAVYGEENPEMPEDKRLEAAVEEVIAPSMDTLAAEIREIGLPEGGEAEVEAIVGAFDQVAETTVASEGDLLNPQIAKALKEAREAARAYGLGDCRFK